MKIKIVFIIILWVFFLILFGYYLGSKQSKIYEIPKYKIILPSHFELEQKQIPSIL